MSKRDTTNNQNDMPTSYQHDDRPRILVTIVTFNSERTIHECLDSWRYAEFTSWAEIEIVVVDNDSEDNTTFLVNAFRDTHPQLPLDLIIADENRGWGAGNNLGIKSLKNHPDYVLLCNPDASISEDGLHHLLQVMRTHGPKSGIVVPAIDQGDRQILGINPEWTLWRVLIGEFRAKRGAFDRLQALYSKREGSFTIADSYASGAIALFSYKALADVDFFDESIFLFHDDLDISRRIINAGYSLVGTNAAIAAHKGGAGSRILGVSNGQAKVASLGRESELVFTQKWYGRRAANWLARYRAYFFLPIQWALLRIKGASQFDLSEARTPAKRFLRQVEH